MVLHLPQLLTAEEVGQAHIFLNDGSCWLDEGPTWDVQGGLTPKVSPALAQASEASRRLQALILQALQRTPLFFSAVLPKRIWPPLFKRSGIDHVPGPHVDGALMAMTTGVWLRTDVACTVFLSEPSDCDGGELLLQDTHGSQCVKLGAGDAVLYPSTLVHQVTPVTRGERLVALFWIESLVRSKEQRHILFDLDTNVRKLRQQLGETPETTVLTAIYHNLLRQWSDT